MRSKVIVAAVALSVTVLGGCATTQKSPSNGQLEQARMENAQLRQELAETRSAASQSQQSRSDIAMYPANAKPGECYASVMTPAQFTTETNRVEVSPSTEKLHVVPAQYEWDTKQVMVRESSTKVVPVPATYTTQTKRIMVSPAKTRLVTIAAEYNTVTTQVVDVPAHTVWKRGDSLIPGAIETRVDSDTGDIMCLVTVPATYRTITKKVLVQPERVVEKTTPAEYDTVTQRVVKTPATTRTIKIPAEYKTVRVRQLVSESRTTTTTVPAEYDTVTTKKLVSPESLSWQRVVCETNMTPELARTLQRELARRQYYTGKIDGLYGPLTMTAVSSYAEDRQLPGGEDYITYSILESLDISTP